MRSTTSRPGDRVAVSFEEPEYTADSDALGTLRIAGGGRAFSDMEKTVRFYQASTFELYGQVQEIAANRTDAVSIRDRLTRRQSCTRTGSPVNYREAYGMFAVQRHSLQS